MDSAYLWLAGSPDGQVSDPCGDDTSEHLGLVEIKNPFSSQSQTLIEATNTSTFCLEKDDDTTSPAMITITKCKLYCTVPIDTGAIL